MMICRNFDQHQYSCTGTAVQLYYRTGTTGITGTRSRDPQGPYLCCKHLDLISHTSTVQLQIRTIQKGIASQLDPTGTGTYQLVGTGLFNVDQIYRYYYQQSTCSYYTQIQQTRSIVYRYYKIQQHRYSTYSRTAVPRQVYSIPGTAVNTVKCQL